MLSDKQRITQSDVLLEIARDLTASLPADDRYSRLLVALGKLIPYDAACLLRLDGEELVPLAAHGLTEEAVVQRYPRGDHPRLDVILRSPEPVLFPPDSDLADPFDGMLAADSEALSHIHACLGCALIDEGQVVGALTADALQPHAFDGVDRQALATVGALAASAMRTTTLIERLEAAAEHQGHVLKALQSSTALHLGEEIVGASDAMKRLADELRLVSGSELPVLVTGETGTGKELVAREVHRASPRSSSPLIEVNCAALPESIAESELFGHVRGAFTGAVNDRPGKLEVADGGTLLLDEIGELPLSLQPKLLRALQQGEIQRVGSDRVHRVDVRIISVTNRNLEEEIERGRFRADLYHRLSVFPIRVPPLRERPTDIPLLAAHFLNAWRRRLGLGPLRLTEEAKARLVAAEWAGNVRELENVLSRAVLRASRSSGSGEATLVRVEDLLGIPSTPPPPSAKSAPREKSLTLQESIDDFQRRLIRDAVARHGGNWAAAARELGVHRSNLHHRARRLGLKD